MNIRLVREAGGIGDVVRVLPVLAALRAKHPHADLYLYAPPEFRDLYEHGGVPFHFLPAPMARRRPRNRPLDPSRWPYLTPPPGVTFELDIDLYCPAFRYELEAGLDVEKDRIQLFCEAAGVWPCEALPRYYVRPDEARRALRWLAQQFPEPPTPSTEHRPLVGLQPFSTDPARDWPETHWVRLANGLERAGCRAIVLDGCVGRTRQFRQPRLVGKSHAFAAAVIGECDLMVTPDSGLFHLAAAVDTPAVGLFASQPGHIHARHYRGHTVLTPPPDAPVPRGCPWPRPCIWKRPAGCTRLEMKRDGRTCDALAALPPDRVLRAALARLPAAKPA